MRWRRRDFQADCSRIVHRFHDAPERESKSLSANVLNGRDHPQSAVVQKHRCEIFAGRVRFRRRVLPCVEPQRRSADQERLGAPVIHIHPRDMPPDRKSTRLNSSHSQISYAVFCLKKNTTLSSQCDLAGTTPYLSTTPSYLSPDTNGSPIRSLYLANTNLPTTCYSDPATETITIRA